MSDLKDKFLSEEDLNAVSGGVVNSVTGWKCPGGANVSPACAGNCSVYNPETGKCRIIVVDVNG